MNTPGSPTQFGQAFKVLIVYENLAGAVRAKEMSQRLATELESKCETWKFELLTHPGLREYAAREASEADMIIVAARDRNPLPEHVKEWVRAWVPRRKAGPTILVGLLDDDDYDREEQGGESDDTPSNFEFLRRSAEQAGMDFVSNWDQVPALTPMEPAGEAASPVSQELLLRRRRSEEVTLARVHCHAA